MTSRVAETSQLVLVYAAGVDAKDNPVYKTKSYKYIDVQATPEQVFEIGTAIAGLQLYPVIAIEQDITYRVVSAG